MGDGPCTADAVDARGVARAADGACDPGAFEEQPAEPVTSWVVDDAGDEPDADPGDGECEVATGGCTLRAAMTEAAFLLVPPMGPTGLVTIEAGVDPVMAPGSPPMAADGVRIVGNGSTIDVNGNPILFQNCAGNLVIEDVTVTGAGAGASPIYAWWCDPVGDPFQRDRVVEIRESAITGNDGYGVATDGATNGVHLTVVDSVISGNGAGGAFGFNRGNVTDSAIVDNGGPAYRSGEGPTGIGVRRQGHFTRTRVSGNDGGVILDAGMSGIGLASATITDSVFVDNGDTSLRTTDMVAVLDRSLVSGDVSPVVGVRGWIFVQDSTVTGGENAVYMHGGDVTLYRATLDGTEAVLAGDPSLRTVISVTGSVIAGPGVACASFATSVSSRGGNVVGDASCGLTGTGDLQGVDALLGPLADNGGPSPTRMPAAGSPAVNRIPLSGGTGPCSSTTPTTDQRGVSRPQGGRCDAGAVERRTSDQD